ncbi:aminotransferase, classes I and II [Coccomyxa subellipsoidea C-169]|uniref:Aminotransferase, classes I and II n=1 Tax=Coccomyxa subellipsoidea (strain C-169) TaxID=574566 RepID=I0YY29_COCSC|nr:aminotransferase, classes I and II [Coccomyxa subellipsoidea C-169]EIE23298.1 aminotransferase, classes I and II [Coccomyxa subellipsoidea C-169]|eukprot:XP_005647842.1 aminotransferase, classes I and II [Coccomyxa subellipsoidea C-169]
MGDQSKHLPEEFKLERFLARYEFTAPYTLCCSDSQPLSQSEVLALADDECRRKWDQLSLAYTEPEGLPELREEVAKLYNGVSAKDVLIMGPQEALSIAMLAMLRPGDHVVVTFPGYQSLYQIAHTIGAEVSFWHMRADEEGRLVFQMSELRKLVRPTTRAVVVNFPHNPSGALLSLADWETLVEQCRAAGAYLFSDEMYRMLERDPGARLPAAAECYERGVSLCGMSKALGMPGIRIGWLATRDASLHPLIQRLHDYSTICNSAPSEVLALIGLRARDWLISANLDLIEANLGAARAFFARHSDTFEWYEPAAGSVAFPRLRTGEPVDEFCERLVQKSGVLLLPATVYEHAPSVAEGRFRIGLGRLNFKECLKHLEDFLQKEKESA